MKDTSIKITKNIQKKAPHINLQISERIKRRFNEIKGNYELRIIPKEVYKTFKTQTIFVPASRSFFSLIQQNIFLLNFIGISTDFFINQFGLYYEKFKHLPEVEDQNINAIFTDILKGEFYYDEEKKELFIYPDQNKKVRLKDSSTGQQELVPIFILLNAILQEKEKEHFLIIEEPGSHLFPATQRKLMELFAMIFNKTSKKNGFLFTTHSPYILSSLNILIQAGNVLKTAKTQNININDKLSKIISPDKAIDFEDISVYIIKDGKLKLLMNSELRLIEPDLLDEVSEELSRDFSDLLDLEYSIKQRKEINL